MPSAMYFDSSSYSAAPMWPTDVATMNQQWYGGTYDRTYSSMAQDNYSWNQSYGHQNYQSYGHQGYQGDYGHSYGHSHQGSQVVLDNRLAHQSSSQLANLREEPDEVLVVNSESSGAYAFLCADAAHADLIAFDAEWAPDHEYGSDNPISVLQLAFPLARRVYVIQLGRLRDNRLPQDVQMMLVNPEVRKVGFAVDVNDISKMARSGIALTKGSVTDVQELCAAALGLGQASKGLSLKNAAWGLLGVRLEKDKRLSCSDWASKELTPEQVRYAALDAWMPLRLCYQLSA